MDDPRFPEHKCSRFKDQPCVFCRMNAELRPKNLEAVPFDVSGEYVFADQPNVKIRPCKPIAVDDTK